MYLVLTMNVVCSTLNCVEREMVSAAFFLSFFPSTLPPHDSAAVAYFVYLHTYGDDFSFPISTKHQLRGLETKKASMLNSAVVVNL